MKKLIVLVLSLVAYYDCGAQADDTKTVQVNVSFGTPDNGVQDSLRPGKTIAALGVGAITGGALFGSTLLSKNFEALNNPIVYVFLASFLLYNQREMVQQYLGKAYSSVSDWASIVALTATATAAAAYERSKKILGFDEREGDERPAGLSAEQSVSGSFQLEK